MFKLLQRMKKRHFLGLVLLAPVVAFFSGPRPNPDLTLRDTSVPDSLDDLEAWLRTTEESFDDITPGTEKTVVWHDAAKRKTPLSVVYLHGFSASRQETAPLCDIVARELGANLFYTRLTGHGRPGAALAEASVNDWINDAAEAVRIGLLLGDEVVLVGTSTGATLSTWLLTRPGLRDGVKANIMLAPNFALRDRGSRIALWPWGKQIVRGAVGKMRSWQPKNALQEKYWTTVYPSEAIVTMMSLVDAVAETDLSELTTPSLVMYAELDDVISVTEIKERFPEFGASRKKLVAVDTSSAFDSHVIAGDIVSPGRTDDVAREIVDFVKSLDNED